MKPNLSYIIWFSQRTGSTLLCQALESTGIAGRPAELLHHVAEPAGLYAKYQVSTPDQLQHSLLKTGSEETPYFREWAGLLQFLEATVPTYMGQEAPSRKI